MVHFLPVGWFSIVSWKHYLNIFSFVYHGTSPVGQTCCKFTMEARRMRWRSYLTLATLYAYPLN
jgi:hypothetical protein